MSLISTPLFKTNGKEELAAADVYSLSNAIPINKIFEAAKNAGKGLLDAAGGRDGLINGVSTLLQMKKQGVSGKELFERGLQTFGTNTTALLTKGGGLVIDKAGEFAGIDPSVMDKVKITADGVAKTYQGNQSNNLQQLLQLAAGVSGNSEYTKYINIGMEASLWGATISKAVEYNYPDIISTISATVDPDVMKQSMIYASSTVMQSGSLESVLSMLEVITVDDVLGTNPDFVKSFLAAFKITETWSPADYPAKAVLLNATLLRFNPNWSSYTRAAPTAKIFDLKCFTSMSTDGKKLLTNIAEMKDVIQMAGNFPLDTSYNICRTLYPLAVASLK